MASKVEQFKGETPRGFETHRSFAGEAFWKSAINEPSTLLSVGGLREGPVLTDLDADGFPDLVVPAMHTLYLLPGASGGFGPVRQGDASSVERGIAAGQFDCDPPPELLMISAGPGASLAYLPAPPDLTSVQLVPNWRGPSFRSATSTTTETSTWCSVA